MQRAGMNIIICVPFPFTRRDHARYGVDYFLAKGYAVHVFDLTKLYRPFAKRDRVTVPEEIRNERVRLISSLNDFRTALNGITGEKIVFTHHVSSLWTSELCALLVRNGIPNFLVEIGSAHPGDNIPVLYDQGVKRIFRRMRLIANEPEGSFRYMLSNALGKKKVLPDRIFINSRREYQKCCSVFGDINDRVIATHTGDFDIYKEVRDRELPLNQTCVFLDENTGINHDEQVEGRGVSRIALEKYYASMNRFFGHVERETGLRVVIAASPRSDYSDNPHIFGGRPIMKYRTAELVAQSSLVILHRSTSVNFAVLFRKPVVMTIADELTDIRRTIVNVEAQCREMARLLDRDVINVDRPEEVRKIDLAHVPINDECYARYVADFISFDKANERPYWEIVEEEIRKECSDREAITTRCK